MMASYLPVSASVRAAEGISNAPGTRTISMSFSRAPERTSPSYALRSSLSVINSLKRETTIPKRSPDASSFPARVFRRIFSVMFWSLCLVRAIGFALNLGLTLWYSSV
jgi:hypothetical protein